MASFRRRVAASGSRRSGPCAGAEGLAIQSLDFRQQQAHRHDKRPPQRGVRRLGTRVPYVQEGFVDQLPRGEDIVVGVVVALTDMALPCLQDLIENRG